MCTRVPPRPLRTDVLRAVGLAVVCLLALPRLAPAGEAPGNQRRQFRIAVDGVDRGRMSMKIAVAGDGAESMESDAEVVANYLVYKYQYSSRGVETWKGGRLQKLESNANYNGKVYQLRGAAQGDKFRLQVNKQERAVRGDVWLTSYWKLPADARQRKEFALIDADKGTDIAARMQFVGSETLTIDGRRTACEHFRLSGAVKVDLWYDAEQRLVKQDSMESGHRTTITLQRVETARR